MNFKDIKISVKLAIGFCSILILLVGVAIFSLTRMGQMQDRTEMITKVNNVESGLAIAMKMSAMDRKIAVRNIALLKEESDMRPELERIKKSGEQYDSASRKLEELFASDPGTTEQERALLRKSKELSATAAIIVSKAAELGFANKNDEATTVIMKELRPVQRKWEQALDELSAFEDNLNHELVQEGEREYTTARTLVILVSLAAVAFGIAVAWSIARGITKPLEHAVQLAKTIASGDLTGTVASHRKDEMGQLLEALAHMSDNLTGIVTEVRSGTTAIASASNQIAAGNMDLSARTEHQASALEQTASSMEELTSTIQQNAESAQQAARMAESASTVASKGGEVVGEVVATMSAINDSSKKITDIIGVIDGIAFQTNILALNAAVEAARAGEQGRGFAVVATEVRNLAQRSASAAKEIKQLISDSVTKIDAGTRLAHEAGTTMQEVVQSVERVTRFISDISSAVQEQGNGIQQVNQAIGQMDQVTQQNAALVEEAAAAAQSMNDQAANLVDMVGVFKIADARSRPAVRVGQTAPALRLAHAA